MWEIAGLILMSTETKEKVRTGLKFFHDSLLQLKLNTESLIFFTDKDFDYIDVSRVFFQFLVYLEISFGYKIIIYE